MEIRSESRISHSREVVYEAYRDRLAEVAVYMPDVREIIVHTRDQLEAGPRIHNEWVSSGELPSVMSKVIKPEHMRWDDHALWDDANWHVDWRIRTRVFTEAVECSGRNSFVEDGPNATLVRLSGDLQIHLGEFPGMPNILARRLKPRVESFIIGMITPNLKKVNECLQTFLDDQAR